MMASRPIPPYPWLCDLSHPVNTLGNAHHAPASLAATGRSLAGCSTSLRAGAEASLKKGARTSQVFAQRVPSLPTITCLS